MDTQTNTDNWLAKEAETFKNNTGTFEQLPSLKLVPNVITEFDIDFSKPFQKWTDESDAKKIIIKAIIPVTQGTAKLNWWVNVKNPVYHEVIEEGRKGTVHFKILQTGTLKQTKYTLVK